MEEIVLEKIRTFKMFVRYKYKTKVPVNADSNDKEKVLISLFADSVKLLLF